MARPFIFRIHAAELFTQIQDLNTQQKADFITQLSVDLLTLKGNSLYSKQVIDETLKLIEVKRENGKKGGRPQKLNKPKAKLNKPKAKLKEEVEVKEEKKEYAEKVLMTEDQYLKLIAKHGDQKTSQAIEKLSVSKCANKKMKYDSDYHAILKWVIAAIEKEPAYIPGKPRLVLAI